MNKLMTFLIGVIVVGVLAVYMFTFQVRYDEVAVLTTFDRAEDPAPDAAPDENSGSVYRKPGIYTKLMWPFQSVEKYSRKLQLLEDQLEEMQTADGYSVIVKTFLVWRIEDPIAFFRSLENEENAAITLRPLMGSLKGVISRYRFDELVNVDPDELKLDEVEQKCAAYLREKLADSRTNYGIAIDQVGIRRLILPEDITEKVFQSMNTTRQRMAAQARSEGEAEAATIRSEAQSAKDRIMAFADRRATEIEAQGMAEAASYYKAFDADPDFAIFLKQMDVLKRTLPNNTQFIIDANELDTFNLKPPAATSP